MPKFKRHFLINRGEVAVIQDSSGNRVTFDTIDELNRCTDRNFSDKYTLNYEPEKNIFFDSEDESVNNSQIPHGDYEELISNIDAYKDRKKQPLYGLSGQAYLDKQEELNKEADVENRRNQFRQANKQDGIKTVTIEQLDNYLDGKYDPTAYNQAYQALQDASTNAEIKQALVALFGEIRNIFGNGKEVDRRIARALLEFVASTE